MTTPQLTIRSGAADDPWPGGHVRLNCRTLPNPHSVRRLCPLDGRHPAVRAYLLRSPETRSLLVHGRDALLRGMSVQFTCLAGRHRSVALAELLWVEARLEPALAGVDLVVIHPALGDRRVDAVGAPGRGAAP